MNLKCECYIHSLKQGEKNVLGEATILKPFVGRYFVDDVYGIVRHPQERGGR